MERPTPFPHRQLLGWIYLGLGIVAAYGGVKVISAVMETDDPDAMVLGLLLIVILSLLSLLCVLTGYTLVASKGAARPLTIALSSILIVFSVLSGLLGLASVRLGILRYILPPLLALGIYGIVVALRIQSPPRSDTDSWWWHRM